MKRYGLPVGMNCGVLIIYEETNDFQAEAFSLNVLDA